MELSVPAVLGAVTLIGDIVVKVLAVIYVPRNRRPQTALAWLLAIFLLPYLGIALYLLAGNWLLPKKRRDKQLTINTLIKRTADSIDDGITDLDLPDWLAPIETLNRTLGAMPMVGGNRATVYKSDAEGLAAMVAAIDGARGTVHAEFYIMSVDDTSQPFFDALLRAHARGVTVRVLFDHLGSRRYKGYKEMKRMLKQSGIHWHFMLPFFPLAGQVQRPDLRNHRKLLVIDGTAAFTGSRNIITPSYQKRHTLRWHDFMVLLEGPVVAEIEAVFISDWFAETDEILDEFDLDELGIGIEGDLACQVVPSGPGFEGENNLRLFNSLVYSARKRIVLTSPYFVPDDSMLYAITTAAQSGIEVELFVSEIGDQFFVYHAQRSYYEALLKAGVRIWLYEKPTVLHAKHFTIDDELSVFGSSNMDMRSFTLDLEVTVVVLGESFHRELTATQDQYRAHSRELTLDEWNQRGFFSRALDNVARLTAAVQ